MAGAKLLKYICPTLEPQGRQGRQKLLKFVKKSADHCTLMYIDLIVERSQERSRKHLFKNLLLNRSNGFELHDMCMNTSTIFVHIVHCYKKLTS
jgi:hypothetical protein